MRLVRLLHSGGRMSNPSAIIGPRFVERFTCIAGDCEDTCCRDGEVIIDADHLRKLLVTAGGAEERDRIHAAIAVREGWQGDPSRYGTLIPGPDGRCAFLDDERRCEIHARSGADALWNACADYPRRAARTGDRLEISATLGCPEVARLALLAPDGTDLVAIGPEKAPRAAPAPSIAAEPARAYDRYLDDVRGAVLHVLAATGMPADLRLFILSVFGERTAPFFHDGSLLVDEARLRDELLLVRHPEVHASCREALGASESDPRAVVESLLPPLKAALGHGTKSGLGAIAAAVLGGAAVTSDEALAGAPGVVDRLLLRHVARRAAWATPHAARLDRYVTNFAQSFWLHDWFTRSKDLRAHGKKLVARVALLRLLVLGHPGLDGVDPGASPAGAALDAAAVAVVSKLARAMDRDAVLAARVDRAFDGDAGDRLERLALRF